MIRKDIIENKIQNIFDVCDEYEVKLSHDKIYPKLIEKFNDSLSLRNNDEYKESIVFLLENWEDFIQNKPWRKSMCSSLLGIDMKGGIEDIFDNVEDKELFVNSFLIFKTNSKIQYINEKFKAIEDFFIHCVKNDFLNKNLLDDSELNKILDSDKNDLEKRVAELNKIIERIDSYIGISVAEKKEFGEVFTPGSLVSEVLDVLPQETWSNPDFKILDNCNGIGNFPVVIVQRLMEGLKDWESNAEKRYKHIMENMIYVCDISTKNMFIYLNLFDREHKYNMNYHFGSFLEKGFDDKMKEWGIEKFDIVVGNPPYTQNIDLKFLTKSYDISDKILYIHPSIWIIDKKGKNKIFKETRDHVYERLNKVTLFNGNPIFNIGLFYPCSITYLADKVSNIKVLNKMKNEEYFVDSIGKINMHGNGEIFNNIKLKILKHCKKGHLWGDRCKRIYNGTKTTNNKKYEVGFSPIRGHVFEKDNQKLLKDDYYTFLQIRKPFEHIGKTTKYKLKYGFDTQIESENFRNYLMTKIARFSLSLFKTSQTLHGGELESVPWLDFTKEWTDEKLIKHFKITDEEWKFIDESIPEYYNKKPVKIEKSIGANINTNSKLFKIGEVYEYTGRSKKITTKEVKIIKQLKTKVRIKDKFGNIVDVTPSTIKEI